MSRRADPARIYQARHDATRNRLIGEDRDGLEHGRAYWDWAMPERIDTRGLSTEVPDHVGEDDAPAVVPEAHVERLGMIMLRCGGHDGVGVLLPCEHYRPMIAEPGVLDARLLSMSMTLTVVFRCEPDAARAAIAAWLEVEPDAFDVEVNE